MNKISVWVGEKKVIMCGEHARVVAESSVFRQWCDRLDPHFTVEEIKIQSVDFTVRNGLQQILFVKFSAVFTDADELVHKNSVFMRGGAVILFIVLACEDGVEYVVTVGEQRFPAGVYDSVGLPAGMLDGAVDYATIAAKELKEETGIEIPSHDFVDMTEKYYGPRGRVDVSRGGSDEFYCCFFARVPVSRDEVTEICGRIGGVSEEGEQTRVGVVPIEKLLKASPQASTIIAYTLYKELGL